MRRNSGSQTGIATNGILIAFASTQLSMLKQWPSWSAVTMKGTNCVTCTPCGPNLGFFPVNFFFFFLLREAY